MAEEAAATADKPEGEKPEGEAKPEGKPEGTDEAQLGPEGEKALSAFKSRARNAEKETKTLRERLEKIEHESKSETEKALDKARKEAKAEAEAGFENERRSDRLAVAVAGHARELADVDDVVLNLKGEDSDLFGDDGKVDADKLKKALESLLKRKPHLKATDAGKPHGSADGGQGEGGEGRSFNDAIRQAAR